MNFTKTHYLFLLFGLTLLVGCGQERPNVLLTGYWPPTNQMLVEFSTDSALNPSDWQGEDWRGFGYNVYACFPTFPKGTDVNPAGKGDLCVDYQDTFADFERITNKLQPEVIICYGRGDGPWEIEVNAPAHQAWTADYTEPKQPDWRPDADTVLHSTLPTKQILDALQRQMPNLGAWIDHQGNPDNFLCGYIMRLATEYQQAHDDCAAAGFIHVGKDVSIEDAKRAQELTLRVTLESLSETPSHN